MEVGKLRTLGWQVAVAMSAVAIGAGLRFWPLQNLGTSLAYITFFPAVTIAAMYGGGVSGMLASLLSTAFVYFWQSHANPDFGSLPTVEGMAIFLVTGTLLAILSEWLFRARLEKNQATILAELKTMRAEDAIRAQHEIEQRERRFRELFDNSPTGMVAVDPNTFRFLQANLNAQRMYGYSEEELRARTIAEVTYPDDLEETRQHNERLADGQMDKHFGKKRYLRRDGSYFWAQFSVSTIKGRNGKAELFIGSFYDITELVASDAKIAVYVQQLQNAMRQTLQAVATMVEQRDPYTAGHERRVGIIAADIAREMGWSEEKCRELELIGLVHDIGKIGVPAEILSKPTRLTPTEYSLVKSHAERGYEILKDVNFSIPIAEIIYQHHERMDGSGYPRGLQGKDILAEARVVAVADVIESMASHRPYRPALGLDAAINEIESHRGTLYCPDAVDALLRLVRDGGYQLPQ